MESGKHNMTDSIKELFILDVIRHTGNCVPYPLKRPWSALSAVVSRLEKEDLLTLDEDCYKITEAGKRALLFFAEERRVMNAPLDRFKEILIDGKIVDGRIPMMSFLLEHSGSADVADMMQSAIFSVKWDDMINSIKEMSTIKNSKWQKVIAQDLFYEEIFNLADPKAWLTLGESEEEATSMGMWLLNPGFVQITV